MQHMKLLAFRVTNFRSVEDSDWIEVDTVTGLIGTNESGKTNIIMPLWKLKPARGGEIESTADYPRKRYNEIRTMEHKPVFIRARFQLSENLAQTIAQLAGAEVNDVRLAEVSRDFDGKNVVSFPEATPRRTAAKTKLQQILACTESELAEIEPFKTEASLAEAILDAVRRAHTVVEQMDGDIDAESLTKLSKCLSVVALDDHPKGSKIVPRYKQLQTEIGNELTAITAPHPSKVTKASAKVIEEMPSFVYYSNYGNLDSEIYLPHVIDNLKRDDLGAKEGAKVRTLKVLFDFVKLEPQEILKLGRDPAGKLSDEQIAEAAQNKKERDILLQSAGTDLTHKFRDWWQQGEYRFRFQADGDHFRIWVSDDLRPEDIELEGRSSGLQWFLSFYLVFLVESKDAHKGAILLLDEPGLTLHALAQEDLSDFFENLSKTNQIIYSTHSAHMIHADHLDRIRAVYIGNSGDTLVTANLRAASDPRSSRSRSLHPVHSVLGLSSSRTTLQFCQSVIVEGESDQTYLSAMKVYLIAKGLIRPPREMVFLPAGGTKGVKGILPVVAGTSEELPFVVLDADESGQAMADALREHLYAAHRERVVSIREFADMENAEIEDLWPSDLLADAITRYLRGPEEEFSEFYQHSKPIVLQVKAYAAKHGLVLEVPGWKVAVAERAKARLLREPEKIADVQAGLWHKLFARLLLGSHE